MVSHYWRSAILPLLVLVLLSLLKPTLAQTRRTTGVIRQAFRVSGNPPEVWDGAQEAEFCVVMARYLADSTCTVSSQEIVSQTATDFRLGVTYELNVRGGPGILPQYVNFVSQRPIVVRDDLQNIGVLEVFAPTLEGILTGAPVAMPTSTPIMAPTGMPAMTVVTEAPTVAPTSMPVVAPTMAPTVDNSPSVTAQFQQGYSFSAGAFGGLNAEQEMIVSMTLQEYAQEIYDSQQTTGTTACLVNQQEFRGGDENDIIIVFFECTFRSPIAEQMPGELVPYTNARLDSLTTTLNERGLPVQRALALTEGEFEIPTLSPTGMPVLDPTAVPTGAPVVTGAPTTAPSMAPLERTSYVQWFFMENNRQATILDEGEQVDFSAIVVDYAEDVYPNSVTIMCQVDDQEVVEGTAGPDELKVEYSCLFTGAAADPGVLVTHINANLLDFSDDMGDVSLFGARSVRDKSTPTMAPTDAPSMSPSNSLQTQEGSYTQVFGMAGPRGGNPLDEQEQIAFVEIVVEYADQVIEADTVCQVDDQLVLSTDNLLRVDYSCAFTSRQEVMPDILLTHINANIVDFSEAMDNELDLNTAMMARDRDAPTLSPTATPVDDLSVGYYGQEFVIEELDREDTFLIPENRLQRFVEALQEFAVEFVVETNGVETTCSIEEQRILNNSTESNVLSVDYSCTFVSEQQNVSSYPRDFVDAVNGDLVEFTDNIVDGHRDITESLPVMLRGERVVTLAPTMAPIAPEPMVTFTATYEQDFVSSEMQFLNETQKEEFTNAVESLTDGLVDGVTTNCTIDEQDIVTTTTGTEILQITYTCTYATPETSGIDPSTIPAAYTSFVNANEEALLGELGDLPITSAMMVTDTSPSITQPPDAMAPTPAPGPTGDGTDSGVSSTITSQTTCMLAFAASAWVLLT